MGVGSDSGGGVPGMGFLQMFLNQGKDGGGGSSVAPPGAPPVGGTPGGTPGAPAGPQPGFKSTPGFSQPMPLFGNMSDADLDAYMLANGIRQPQGPTTKPAPAVAPAPAAKKYSTIKRWGDGN